MLTSLYLGLLTLVFFKISLDTIKLRQKNQISLGTGPNDELAGHVAAHSNFQAYIPLFGLLLYMYEGSEIAFPTMIHALGLSVLSGRLLHYLGIKDTKAPNLKFRAIGMRLTLIPLVILAVLNIANFVYVTRIKG